MSAYSLHSEVTAVVINFPTMVIVGRIGSAVIVFELPQFFRSNSYDASNPPIMFQEGKTDSTRLTISNSGLVTLIYRFEYLYTPLTLLSF